MALTAAIDSKSLDCWPVPHVDGLLGLLFSPALPASTNGPPIHQWQRDSCLWIGDARTGTHAAGSGCSNCVRQVSASITAWNRKLVFLYLTAASDNCQSVI